MSRPRTTPPGTLSPSSLRGTKWDPDPPTESDVKSMCSCGQPKELNIFRHGMGCAVYHQFKADHP